MKITDRFVIRDKQSEKTLREVDHMIELMMNSPKLEKALFGEVHMAMLELFITVFKRLDDNSTPAKTLLDFTGKEVQDACLRVGPSNVFESDANYVMAVMQELTK